MKMRLALFIFCISFVVESSARTMKQFLMAMPDSVLPVLSLDNRLDAVDFLESGMKATVQNNFGESSTLLRLSDDYASWELSTVVSCELKLLVSGADTTVCMSTTYHSPFPESVLTFYNKDWQPRQCVVDWPTDADFRQIPEGYTLEDWKDLRNKAGMMVLQAKLQEKANEMVVYCHFPMADETAKRDFPALMKSSTTLFWHSSGFSKK